MLIKVLYFAVTRELAGVSEETFETTGAVTIGDLRVALEAHRPALAGRLAQVRFARNEVFAGDDESLAEGDTVALIPPVSGG